SPGTARSTRSPEHRAEPAAARDSPGLDHRKVRFHTENRQWKIGESDRAESHKFNPAHLSMLLAAGI
ncbi:hypothetical protein RUM43_015128, partial [Polyplax serrata]